MVDISTLEYKVVAFDEGGKKHDITDFIENFGWEENDHELAVRLSFTARNDIVSKSRLSSTIKPNCLILAYAKSGKKPFEEVVRGKVVTARMISFSSQESVQNQGLAKCLASGGYPLANMRVRTRPTERRNIRLCIYRILSLLFWMMG